MPAKKKPANTSRSETVTVRLAPKIRYIAEIAAREKDHTLSSFIEWALRRVLTQGDILDEPTYGPNFDGSRQTPPMWGEGLWDVDEADRFYLLATARKDLLTLDEQRLWKFFAMHQEHIGETINLKAFREFWNNPSINTSHLTENDGGE